MSNATLRRFNEAGIAAFRNYLKGLRESPTLRPPFELLDDDSLTTTLPMVTGLSHPGFSAKRDAAEYLRELLKPLAGQDVFRDVGMWTWLTLWFFDDVCPASAGARKPKDADVYYILNPAWNRRYRHLLATPLEVLQVFPKHNRFFLSAALSTHGDPIEQVWSKFYVTRHNSVAEAIDMLFYDEATNGPKSGLFPKSEKRGDLRNRFPIRIKQLRKTYDIAVLDGARLVKLLGDEFSTWVKSPTRNNVATADA